MGSIRTEEGLILKSADVWEVKSPPPTNTLKGHLVPKVLATSRRRRISIEVYSDNMKGKERTEVFVRFLNQGQGSKRNSSKDEESIASVGSVVDGWTQKYKFPVSYVTVDKRVGCACAITTKIRNRVQSRDIIFNSEEEGKRTKKYNAKTLVDYFSFFC